MITLLALAVMSQSYIGDARPIRLSQAQIDRVAAECRVPRRWMRLRGGIVKLHLPKSAPFEKVDCLLRRQRELAGLKPLE
ncbi:MAG TPA: hypothetical protein VF680_02855 [Allosphingosinicella sp.]|jgi:hypothetical protein